MLGMRLISASSLLPLVFFCAEAKASQPAGDLDEIVRAFYQEDYPRAASLAARYLKTHPRDSRARIYLARIEMARGNYASAYKKLREVLISDPRSEDALFYLAKVCGALSQAEFDRLYTLAPDAARVHQLMAESYRVQEKPAEAEQEYRAALAANPRSVEVLVALGDLKRSQSDFDNAIGYYSKAVELEPRNYDAVYGLGASYSYRADHTRAMEFFQRALAVDPNSAPGRLALGHSLIRAGRWEAAIPELKRAVGIEPKMRQAYYLLGQCYQKLGRSGEAQDAFKKVDELAKSEAESARDMLNTDDLISGSSKDRNPSAPKGSGEQKKPPG